MRIKAKSSNKIAVALQIRVQTNVTTENSNDVEIEVDFVYHVGGEEVDLAPLFSGPVWSAIIWENSVLAMCSYMERNPSVFSGKQIVELGCGLGVPGLVAGVTCGASDVYLTDREEDLAVLRRSLFANKPLLDKVDCRFSAIDFDWGGSPPLSVQADVVLATECVSADVYGMDSLTWLVTAITKVAKKSVPVVLFLCSARRKDDGLDIVLRMLSSITMGHKPPELVSKFEDGSRVELYRAMLLL